MNDGSTPRKRLLKQLHAFLPALLSLAVVLLASAPSRFDPDDAIEHSARSRALFGLRADDATHRAALSSPVAETGFERYGMALTPEELVEMDRRADVSHRMGGVERDLRAAAPDSFAAMYLDNQNAGAVVVLATDPSAIDTRKVADLVDGKPFAIRRVERSAKRLKADYDRLWKLASELRASGERDLTGFLLDERGNTLRVFAKDRTARSRIASALADRGVPSYVEFEEASFEPESAVQGGDRLAYCSAGPQVYWDTPSGRQYYTLTAKHCSNSQTHGIDGLGCAKHELPHVAAAQPNQGAYGPTVFADVQMNRTGSSQGYVRWFWPDPERPVVDESHLYGWGYLDNIGMPVCKQGYTTGRSCGELLYKYLVVSDPSYVEMMGGWVTEQRVVKYISDPGDSGGVVYTPVAGGVGILGGHAGSLLGGQFAGLRFYSHIWFMHQELEEQGRPFIVQRWWD